jgi:hypothetical protein
LNTVCKKDTNDGCLWNDKQTEEKKLTLDRKRKKLGKKLEKQKIMFIPENSLFMKLQ